MITDLANATGPLDDYEGFCYDLDGRIYLTGLVGSAVHVIDPATLTLSWCGQQLQNSYATTCMALRPINCNFAQGLFFGLYATDTQDSSPSGYYCKVALFRSLLGLTTINNLAVPIIKTSDKTMKITYTVQWGSGSAVGAT
jgi:hypothetical protein